MRWLRRSIRRRPRLRRCRGAPAVGAVRLGAASEDAHHHAEREDRGLCGPAIASEERRADRHLGRGGTRCHQGEDRNEALADLVREWRSTLGKLRKSLKAWKLVLRRRHFASTKLRRLSPPLLQRPARGRYGGAGQILRSPSR